MKKFIVVVLIIVIAIFVFRGVSDCKDEKPNNNSIHTNSSSNNSSSNSNNSSVMKWQDFLEDYEDFIDSYIIVLKKYKENPTDMSNFSQYTKMMTEYAEWVTELDEIEKELENASDEELVDFLAELSRINLKLSQAMY